MTEHIYKYVNNHVEHGPYEKMIKRPLDCLTAIFLIIIMSPLLAATALLVRIKLGTPVIFKQERPGKDERVFFMLKFRSMTEERNSDGDLLPDKDRLTEFGKRLRASSLDELPELINIIKGEMSFVGPRPLAKVYIPYYTSEEHHRHDVRPGLTGLAQVNGRNKISWEEKFKYDLEYVDRIEFFLDLKIVIMTIKNVILCRGIGQAEERPISLNIIRQNELYEKSVSNTKK